MKAIRRFLSPTDAKPEPRPPRRSMSMRFRTSLSAKPRPTSTSTSTYDPHSREPSFGSFILPDGRVNHGTNHSGLNSGTNSVLSAVSGVSSTYSSNVSRSPGVSRTASSSRGPVRGRRSRAGLAVIDAEDYPRVIATLMQNASRPALLKLRMVCRNFRDMADAQLAQHLILAAPPGVSSLRVTGPAYPPSGPNNAGLPDEAGIPGLSVRVLWNRDERRRLSRILTGTRVVDLRGPARARDAEIADLTLQCACARTVRLRPDASGNPPTNCPLPPRATQLIAFTSLAADGAGLSATEKANRRSSWLVTDREHLHLQPASTAFIGPVPNLIQNLVVTVRYPRAHELAPSPTARIPARPLRPLAPWDHPPSLRSVSVLFMAEEPKRAARPRPRSFLGITTGSSTTSADGVPIFEAHATLKAKNRMSWRGSSPVTPTFPSLPLTPTTPSFKHASLSPIDAGCPSPAAPALMFSDADAERASDLSRLGYLSPFIRSVAAHLPRVSYTLVDANRIDPVVLGFAPGTLLSPRQIELLINKALRAELAQTGWDAEETEYLMGSFKYMTRQAYALSVGPAEFALQTVE